MRGLDSGTLLYLFQDRDAFTMCLVVYDNGLTISFL